MMLASTQTDSSLPDRLRRCLTYGGYAIGTWSLFVYWGTVLAWGLPFNRHFAEPGLTALYLMTMTGLLFAPTLLLAGCWGFQHHRPWSRPILFGYAVLWIASVWGQQLVDFISLIANPPRTEGGAIAFTLKQNLIYAIGQFDMAVCASLFAAFVIFCLRQPEIRDRFADTAGEFEVRPESNQN